MTQSPSAISVNRGRGRRGTGGIQPYDFQRPIKLAREHTRLLQIAFETFARGLAGVAEVAGPSDRERSGGLFGRFTSKS